MASGVFDDALIKHLWSTDELRAIFSDVNRVQKWYEFEAAHGIEGGVTFERALMENKKVRDALSADELRAVLGPTTYVGHAPQIVERVLEQQRGWLEKP